MCTLSSGRPVILGRPAMSEPGQRCPAHDHLAVPTPDHYLPLLYVIALRREGEQVSFPAEGFDGGSVSMLTVRVG